MKKSIKLNLLILSIVIFSVASVQMGTAPGQGFPRKVYDAIVNGYQYVNPVFGYDTIYADQGSFFVLGWQYLESEWENHIFAQPLDFNLYINGEDVKLQRTAVGNGLTDCFGGQYGEDCKGPIFRWYVVWEPYTFDPGTLDFDIEITSSTNYLYFNGEVTVL